MNSLRMACAVGVALLAGCSEDVNKKIGQAGQAAKEKAGAAVEATREKAGEAVEKAGEAVDTAKEKAGEAIDAAKELTVGGVNLGTEFTALVDKLKTTLGEIKDGETAEKAETGLKEADATLAGLLEKAEKLPETARPTLMAALQKALVTLKPLIDKVLAIDGVGEKLKPLLDGILARLTPADGGK